MALAFPGQSGPLWEIMARDAFVESLGDPALRLRVLERDPEILEQALKLASRLEALKCCEMDDNWDDLGQRKDRYVKTSTAEDASELTSLLQELRTELKQSRKERERSRKAGDGCRGGPEFVAGKTDESVRPAQYFDRPAGAFCAGDLRSSPWTPPTPPQGPLLAPPQGSTPDPYAGATTWMTPPAPSIGSYYGAVQQPVAEHQTSPPVKSSSGGAPRSTQSWSRSNDRCHFCQQRGHWKDECPDRIQRQRAQGAFKPNIRYENLSKYHCCWS